MLKQLLENQQEGQLLPEEPAVPGNIEELSASFKGSASSLVGVVDQQKRDQTVGGVASTSRTGTGTHWRGGSSGQDDDDDGDDGGVQDGKRRPSKSRRKRVPKFASYELGGESSRKLLARSVHLPRVARKKKILTRGLILRRYRNFRLPGAPHSTRLLFRFVQLGFQ